jgi:hypothetical protein
MNTERETRYQGIKAATLAKQTAAYLSASAEDAGEEETAEAA